MKNTDNFESLIANFYKTRQAEIQTTPQFDERVLNSSSQVQHAHSEDPAGTPLFRHRAAVGLVAAGIVILGVILVLSIFYRVTMPVYAAEIVQAIKKVETVHMMVDFYKQGEFECWMKFNGDPNNPTHVWLGDARGSFSKICSPAGVFELNSLTRRVLYCTRDERGREWILKFGSFFENNLRYAKRTETLSFDNPNAKPIVIHIETQKRVQEFLVDPATRLPISFTTVRDDDPMEMMRYTLAVRNLKWIRYNEIPPEGIFEMPRDAIVVDKEVDCLVGPDSGLISDGVNPQDACMAIVQRSAQALVDLDADTLRKLDLAFRMWPPELWEKARQIKASGHFLDRFVIKGSAYQAGDVWYIPIEYRAPDGRTEVQTPMIKFYQFEGKTYCYIIGTKEKGVVD